MNIFREYVVQVFFMKYLILYSRVFLEIHENHFYVNENSHC